MSIYKSILILLSLNLITSLSLSATRSDLEVTTGNGMSSVEDLSSARKEVPSYGLAPTPESVVFQIAYHAPKKFKGLHAVDPSLVNQYRRKIEEEVTSCPDMALRGFVTEGQVHARLKSLYNEVAPGSKVPEDATVLDLTAGILIQTFKMPMNEFEEVIYKGLPDSSRHRLLRRFAESDTVWPFKKSIHDLARDYMADSTAFKNLPSDNDWGPEPQSGAFNALEEKFEGASPSIVLPYFTRSPMSLYALAYWFSRDICPLGVLLPGETAHAHGFDFTPGGFLDHDWFHFQSARNSRGIDHVRAKVLKMALEANIDGDAFLSDFNPIAAEAYQAVLGVYKHLLDRAPLELLREDGKFNVATVGLFLLLHEFPNIDQKSYSTHDPLAVLKKHIANARASANSIFDDPWEKGGLWDDLENGDKPLSDKETFQNMLPFLIEKIKANDVYGIRPNDYSDYRGGHLQFSEAKLRKELPNQIKSVKIERNPYHVEMTVHLKNGSSAYVNRATPRADFTINDDYRILMKIAGRKVEKPDFGPDFSKFGKNLDTDKSLYQTYYKEMRRAMNDHLDDFMAWAARFLDGAYGADYFRASWIRAHGDVARWPTYGKVDQETVVIVEEGVDTIIDRLKREGFAADLEMKPFWKE